MDETNFEAYCPLMKEVCHNGHTKSMGMNEKDLPNICVHKIVLTGKDPHSEKQYKTHACGWARVAIMQSAINQSIQQGTHSVDRNGNIFFKALNQHTQERVLGTSQSGRDLIKGDSNGK